MHGYSYNEKVQLTYPALAFEHMVCKSYDHKVTGEDHSVSKNI